MVIGLPIVFGLLVYLLISLGIVIWVTRHARRQGRSGWKKGLLAVLVMYLLVFWDWIPTVIMYRYDCSTRAGFTVYKSLDEWKQENPGVIETLHPIDNAAWITTGSKRRVPLNQRFAWGTITTSHPFYIREREERIVDIRTGEVLARYIDFYTDFTTRTKVCNFHDLKVWMSWGSCERDGHKVNRGKYYDYEASIESIGKEKK